MRNLEQLRAIHAYKSRNNIGEGKDGGGSVAKKVPALIISNGFLGALAFAIEDNGGYLTVFKAIIGYLQENKMSYGIAAKEPKAFLEELCNKDAAVLRAITAEAMAYLNYLRRFAKCKEASDDRNNA